MHDEDNHVGDFKCDLRRINFETLENMDNHMDNVHEGRWKKYDPDVLREGDVESESETDYSDYSSTEDSEKENGEV